MTISIESIEGLDGRLVVRFDDEQSVMVDKGDLLKFDTMEQLVRQMLGEELQYPYGGWENHIAQIREEEESDEDLE